MKCLLIWAPNIFHPSPNCTYSTSLVSIFPLCLLTDFKDFYLPPFTNTKGLCYIVSYAVSVLDSPLPQHICDTALQSTANRLVHLSLTSFRDSLHIVQIL